MKTALYSLLSLIFLMPVSFAMGKRVCSVEDIGTSKKLKRVTFQCPDEKSEEINIIEDHTVSVARALNEKVEQEEDIKYPQRFYYVPGVSRVVALKYCQSMCDLQPGFDQAWSACENYEDGLYANDSKTKKTQVKNMRLFVKRYSQAVIGMANSLRSIDLKSEEVADEYMRAIGLVHANGNLLRYIIAGKKNGKATLAQLQYQWQKVLVQLEEPIEHEASTESDKE